MHCLKVERRDFVFCWCSVMIARKGFVLRGMKVGSVFGSSEGAFWAGISAARPCNSGVIASRSKRLQVTDRHHIVSGN